MDFLKHGHRTIKNRRGGRNLITTVGQRPQLPRDLTAINHWSEIASCHGQVDLFTVSELDSPDFLKAGVGSTGNDLKKFNISKIEKAIAICDGCEVKKRCELNADWEDRAHTVRGGKWPTTVSPRQAGRPRKGEVVRAANPRPGIKCKRGHEGNWRYKSGTTYWQCIFCERMSKQDKQEWDKANDPQNTCKNGHKNWGSNGGGRKTCLTCRKARRVKQLAKMGV